MGITGITGITGLMGLMRVMAVMGGAGSRVAMLRRRAQNRVSYMFVILVIFSILCFFK